MSKVRLSYDGWLALPEAARRKLGVATGDHLEVELVEGAVILRPTSPAGTVAAAPIAPKAVEPARAEASVATAEPAAAVSEPVKRGRGRPRKVTSAVGLPQGLATRGRRAAAPAR